MSTTITKTGIMYLRPSAWVDQGGYIKKDNPSISPIGDQGGWFGADTGYDAVNEVVCDENISNIWGYCASMVREQNTDGTFKCGLCHEIPQVNYRITGITVKGVGQIDKRTGVWSGDPNLAKVALTVSGNGGSSGDGTTGGTKMENEKWTNINRTVETSVLSNLSFNKNTIPDLNLRVYMRTQGSLFSGQFFVKVSQLYLEITYEYDIVVDVNNSSYGTISSYTGADGTPNATINAATIGTGDIYFQGWYSEYNSSGQEHYKYTNKIGNNLTYNWSLDNPYQHIYAVWYDYPIQIAAGNKRVKHIYAGQTEITSVYSGSKKIYWPNARWEEIV